MFRRQLLRHIDSCLAFFKYKFPGHPLPNTNAQSVALERFASVLAEYGMWKQAKDLQQRVVDFRSKTLGKWHQDTISSKHNLAETLWNLFDIKAAADLQVTILKRHWWFRPSVASWLLWPPWQPEHIQYCFALDDLTRTLWLAGHRVRSKQVGERAVEGLTKCLGREDPRTLAAMFNLGRTCLHLGLLDQSHGLLEWVFLTRDHFFGPRHPDTLMAKNELGMVLCAGKRDLDLAESMVAEVLETRKSILGEEHAYTLWSVNDLSKVLCARGRANEGDNHA